MKKGPKKFLSKLCRAKYHWRRTPLKAWNFDSWVKSSIIIALGYVNHHLWKQLTQNTHTYTHRAHFQRKLSDVQLWLGSSSRYGGAWSFEEEATSCQLQVFFLFFNCPTVIITVIWTRSPRTRRRSKSFQTHNNNNIITNSINLVLCNTTLMIAAS
jgi:hypothetical protein